MKKLLSLAMLAALSVSCSVVSPGSRGIKVSLGEVSPQVLGEGLVWHAPIITSIEEVSIRQRTDSYEASCYSSDLQQVTAQLSIMYRLPEDKVVTLFQKYAGNPFAALIAPRVAEALKELTALETAEGIVKNREKIKIAALKSAQAKIGDLVQLEDVVIVNVNLSKELETAIESKMVQQQEAAKAEFLKQKAQVEAETAIIKAQGQAKAISIRGQAIRENPKLVDFTIAEKWDGKVPQAVSVGAGASSTSILLPLEKHAEDK